MTTKAQQAARASFVAAVVEVRRINAERMEVAKLDRQLEAQGSEQMGRLRANAEHLGFDSLDAALESVTEEELAVTGSDNGSG